MIITTLGGNFIGHGAPDGITVNESGGVLAAPLVPTTGVRVHLRGMRMTLHTGVLDPAHCKPHACASVGVPADTENGLHIRGLGANDKLFRRDT